MSNGAARCGIHRARVRATGVVNPPTPQTGGAPLAMHPADLQAEREQRVRRQHRALARDIRQAAINATPREFQTLTDAAARFRSGAVSYEQAHQVIARVRDRQRDRNTRAA
jgi:hypothetical protein